MKKKPTKAGKLMGLAASMRQGGGKPSTSMSVGDLAGNMNQGKSKTAPTNIRTLRDILGQ